MNNLRIIKNDWRLFALLIASLISVQASIGNPQIEAVLSYIDDNGLLKEAKPTVKKQRYLMTVISAQNRAGRELPNVVTLFPGKLPIRENSVHYSSEGYLMLGKATASLHARHYDETGEPLDNYLLFGQYEFWFERTSEGWKVSKLAQVNRTRINTSEAEYAEED